MYSKKANESEQARPRVASMPPRVLAPLSDEENHDGSGEEGNKKEKKNKKDKNKHQNKILKELKDPFHRKRNKIEIGHPTKNDVR